MKTSTEIYQQDTQFLTNVSIILFVAKTTNMVQNSNIIPESKLIKNEINVREMNLGSEVLLTKKSSIRWLALALGLINPNESRRLLLDILEVLLEYHLNRQKPTTKDIIGRLRELTNEDQNQKAVYYHLLKLKEFGIIGRKKGEYFLGDGQEKPIKEILKQVYLTRVNSAFENIDKVLERLEKK
jgi:hypothetical protein